MPTCPSTRSMRAALGSEPACADGWYFSSNAAAIAATIAIARTAKAPSGQNLILFITPPVLISIGDFFGERYSVGRNYEARRRPVSALLANRNIIAEQS